MTDTRTASNGNHGETALLEALVAAARAAAAPDVAVAFATLIESVRRQSEALAVAVWLRDPQSDELWLKAPLREPLPRLQPGAGLAGRCAQSAQVVQQDGLHAGPDTVDVRLLGADRAIEGGTALCLPLLAGGVVVGVLELLHARTAGFSAKTVLVAELIAAQLALVLQRAAGATDDASTTLRTEVEIARELQIDTLPTSMPNVPGYDLFGHFQPATYAGGDMFDAVKLPEGVFLLLGDATGHGFGPSLSAVEMQGMLRVALRLGAGLDDAYRHVNNQLAEDLPADRFISAFMAFLDATTDDVRYHCAGQGPLLHYCAGRDHCEWIEPTTFPVGVMELADAPAAATVHMDAGDILALISDGLYERIDATNTEFGPDRVADIIRRGQHLPMAKLCGHLLAGAEAFAGGVAAQDDVTLILVRRLP